MSEPITLALASVAVMGWLAQWVAWRTRVPVIVLLMLLGLLAGPVLGLARPSEQFGDLLPSFVKLGVAVILFEGGLRLHFHELAQAAAGVRRLVTIGTGLTLVVGSAAAHLVGGLPWPVAWLFGAIIVVTGPTVIIPLLRQARLKRQPASYLKWEGIINDPIGAILAVLLFQYIVHAGDIPLPALLARQGLGLLVAALLGAGSAYGLGLLFRRGYVPEYLKGPGTLSTVLGVFVLADQVLPESGLLAATILGMVLGNIRLPGIDEIRRFKEYVVVLLVSAVFLVLTADIDPVILLHLDWRSGALLAAVLLVVRPISVFGATMGTDMSRANRLLLAWIAPRGIVAASMAGLFGWRLQQQGYAEAALLLPLVFALILLSVTAHSLTIGWLARKLGLSARSQNGILLAGASPWSTGLAQVVRKTGLPCMIADTSWNRLQGPRLTGIPTYFGELITEEAERSLEFTELGYLVAATDNDAYNSLLCGHFATEVGRHHVFQLAPLPTAKESRRHYPRTIRGLILSGPRATYEDLQAKWYHNWTFQTTQLTDTFSAEDWLASVPKGSLPILCLQEGQVQLHSPESPIKPKPDALIVWFGPKRHPLKAEQTHTSSAGSQRSTASSGGGNTRSAGRPPGQ